GTTGGSSAADLIRTLASMLRTPSACASESCGNRSRRPIRRLFRTVTRAPPSTATRLTALVALRRGRFSPEASPGGAVPSRAMRLLAPALSSLLAGCGGTVVFEDDTSSSGGGPATSAVGGPASGAGGDGSGATTANASSASTGAGGEAPD